MPEKPWHVLVTGAGGSIAVNFTRSLQMSDLNLRLYGCDASKFFIHMAQTEEKVVIPSCFYKEDYLDSIHRLVDQWKIDLIAPSNMNEILVLAANREKLGAKLFVPSLKAIEVGADKWETYLALKNAKIDVPNTLLIEEPKDLDHALSQLGSPAWFRGRGIPGRGLGVASLPVRSAAQGSGWIEFHEAWGNMTASEYLPGDNLTWMGLWRQGELIASQSRKRIAYIIPHVSPSGVTGAPAVSCTVHDDRLDRMGSESMLALDQRYDGVGFVDFKCDRAGKPKVTEVNVGRFGTTHHFYSVAGANFPKWYVQLAMGQLPKDTKPTNVLPADLYWIRSLDAGPALVKKEDLDRFDQASR